MTRNLIATPLNADAFAPYGDVIKTSDMPDKIINQGLCGRYHDLAKLDFDGGRAGISLFDAQARHLPYTLEMVERHPRGSQAFLPLNQVPMLVIVASDAGGTPTDLCAFVTAPGQGINLHRGIWHGVLAPLGKPGLYAVVDRIGDDPNLEEHWFKMPYTVTSVN